MHVQNSRVVALSVSSDVARSSDILHEYQFLHQVVVLREQIRGFAGSGSV